MVLFMNQYIFANVCMQPVFRQYSQVKKVRMGYVMLLILPLLYCQLRISEACLMWSKFVPNKLDNMLWCRVIGSR